MKTPAGKECRFYYEDYNRGRQSQECRLVRGNPDSMAWRPTDCKRCPVPEILLANASKDLELELRIEPRLLGLGRRNTVRARCLRHGKTVEDPYVGCPDCIREKPELDVFREALRQLDDD